MRSAGRRKDKDGRSLGRGGTKETGISGGIGRKRNERISRRHKTQVCYNVVLTMGIISVLLLLAYVLAVYTHQNSDVGQILLTYNEEEGNTKGSNVVLM